MTWPCCSLKSIKTGLTELAHRPVKQFVREEGDLIVYDRGEDLDFVLRVPVGGKTYLCQSRVGTSKAEELELSIQACRTLAKSKPWPPPPITAYGSGLTTPSSNPSSTISGTQRSQPTAITSSSRRGAPVSGEDATRIALGQPVSCAAYSLRYSNACR